jgi:putative tryptophan/tyrosine transport system substrate-binding protein
VPRRAFIASLAGALLATRRPASAQSPARAARIGWLGRSAGRASPTFKAFADGLRDLGYVIGENLIVDVVTPEQDKVEQYPEIARQLVASGVDVILASNPYAVDAATRATTTIPVVAVDFESDPVAKGWVTTLARPGRNVTGFFLDIPELTSKQLQILKEVKPSLSRVAALGDARVNEPQFRATELGAQGTRLTLQRFPIGSLDEIPGALAEAVRTRAGALLVLSSPMIFGGMPHIASAAVKYRLPSISLFVPFFAEAGGLLAYGPAFVDPFRRAASYIDQILKGVQPGQLPVQRPTKFEFVVNRKTAKAIGLTMPHALMLRSDHVINP